MSTTPDSAAPAPVTTFLQRWVWVLAAVVGILSLTLLKMCQSRTLQRLPVLYVLPSFELQDQQERPFGTAQLEGKVWVASFVFTSCKVECPAIGRAVKTLQDKLAGTPVQLVSVSVDPEFDTPAALTTWGREFGADPTRWHLLTGPRAAIEKLVIDGFRSHMGDKTEEGGLVQIAHTMKLVLVDQLGGIRHYFDATDDKAVALVVDHAKALVAEGPGR